MSATSVKSTQAKESADNNQSALKKEATISAFFEKQAEEAFTFLARNPIPAELLGKNQKK